MTSNSKTVVVVGASRKPDRYSYKAVEALQGEGYRVVPMHPAGGMLLGEEVLRSLAELRGPVDTVTMYVRESVSDDMEEALLGLRPRRVVFNPGAENARLASVLQAAGVETLEACTLVMLRTGQF
ncbi:MAG: CoA-binding protein [Kiritimatiellia bacterium]